MPKKIGLQKTTVSNSKKLPKINLCRPVFFDNCQIVDQEIMLTFKKIIMKISGLRNLIIPIIPLFITLSFSTQLSAQNENHQIKGWIIAAKFGSFNAVQKKGGATVVQPIHTGIELSKPCLIALSKKTFVGVGVGIGTLTSVTNFQFLSEASGTTFTPLPSSTRLNKLAISQIYAPVCFNHILFAGSKGAIAATAGLMPGYVFNFKQKLISDGGSITINTTPENKWQITSRFEFGSLALPRQPTQFQWGIGVEYPITNFTQTTESFKPLTFYFKAGINL